jgi:hypothetical protein
MLCVISCALVHPGTLALLLVILDNAYVGCCSAVARTTCSFVPHTLLDLLVLLSLQKESATSLVGTAYGFRFFSTRLVNNPFPSLRVT